MPAGQHVNAYAKLQIEARQCLRKSQSTSLTCVLRPRPDGPTYLWLALSSLSSKYQAPAGGKNQAHVHASHSVRKPHTQYYIMHALNSLHKAVNSTRGVHDCVEIKQNRVHNANSLHIKCTFIEVLHTSPISSICSVTSTPNPP